jgi:DNA-binding SARP family transcriptional activator
MPEAVTIYHVARLKESQPAQPWQLWIALIDGLTILDARGEPVTLRSRTAQALIGYLSLAAGFRGLRDRIAALLWPEHAPAEANAALNNCLRITGKALAGGLDLAYLRRGGYISLDSARITVDIHRILIDLDEGKIDEVLMQQPDWPEAILRGFDSVNSLYGAWVKVTRRNRRDSALEALEAILDRFDRRELVVKRAATAIIALEPSHEGAVRSLMRHYAANHNTAAAIRAYEALRCTLREHYGLEPNADTAALMASLSEPTQPRKPMRPSDDHAPVIVIGAFVAATEGIAAQTSGFRAELIINLSKFRELTIVDLQEQSDSSGVDYVLTAECWQVEAEIRLFAVLKEVTARRVVWSDSYSLSLDKWVSVQRQLVGGIASKVEIYLSHDRLSRTLQRLPADLGVYDAWLRGEHLLLRWSASSEDEAERLFEQAISEDANFAPAHASLASVYTSRQFIRPGLPCRPEEYERAFELARRAVELDPLDARNLMALAWSTAIVQRFDQAELYFELASELNPNDPKVVVSASLGHAFMGRIDLAKKLLDHAMALTTILPAYQWSHIAIIRFFASDYAGAVEAADRSQNVIIDTPGWKAAALSKLGRGEEQRASLDQLLRAAGATWAGPTNPSREDIIAWFLDAFPIRHDSEKQNLAALLRSR